MAHCDDCDDVTMTIAISVSRDQWFIWSVFVEWQKRHLFFLFISVQRTFAGCLTSEFLCCCQTYMNVCYVITFILLTIAPHVVTTYLCCRCRCMDSRREWLKPHKLKSSVLPRKVIFQRWLQLSPRSCPYKLSIFLLTPRNNITMAVVFNVCILFLTKSK